MCNQRTVLVSEEVRPGKGENALVTSLLPPPLSTSKCVSSRPALLSRSREISRSTASRFRLLSLNLKKKIRRRVLAISNGHPFMLCCPIRDLAGRFTVCATPLAFFLGLIADAHDTDHPHALPLTQLVCFDLWTLLPCTL